MLRSRALLHMSKDSAASDTAQSHRLLVRAGLFRPATASGLLTALPAGLRVLDKLQRIIAEELESEPLCAQRLSLPLAMSRDLWVQSGRWSDVQSEVFSIKDRHGANLLLCPTHEEAVTDLVSSVYGAIPPRLLPLVVYQMAPKFRDERRPRGGLLRGREFIMKDMYSFHATLDDAMRTYAKTCDAYERIFRDRLRVDALKVAADSGKMGGQHSHEFHIASDAGEDVILSCDQGTYRANVEKASFGGVRDGSSADGNTVIVSVNGMRFAVPKDRKIAQAKLATFKPREDDAAMDAAVDAMKHGLVEARDGDACVGGNQCTCAGHGVLRETKGIEIAHTFLLGTRYSQPLNANVVGPDGARAPLVMGCYGIGVSRLVAAVIEARGGHDSHGLLFPRAIAPFSVCMFSAPQGSASAASECFAALKQRFTGDVLFDDREQQSFGVKMAEARLLGVPWIVVVTKSGALELHERARSADKPRVFATSAELLSALAV